MSTNYYARSEYPLPCEVHIGKSNMGWAFALHVIPELKIDSLDVWKEIWARPGVSIFDEYGREVTPDEMLSTIVNRSHPRGLRRHSGDNLAGHGEGTWDLCTGDFS